jgi:hypothetical protein
VCVFAYSTRTDKPIFTELDMLISWEQGEVLEGSQLGKRFLISIPGEGGSCRSETKQDRRTAPRPNLFISPRRLQEQRLQPRKSVLGSSPSDNAFVARKLSTIEEWRRDKNYLYRQRDYRNKGNKPKIDPAFEFRWRCWVWGDFFYDIQQHVSNYHSCVKLLGNKDW